MRPSLCLLFFGFLLLGMRDAHAQRAAVPPAGATGDLGLFTVEPAPASDALARDFTGSARSLDGAMMSSFTWTLLPALAGLAVMAAGGGEEPLATGGFLLMSGGLVVGPSVGHLYLGDRRRAWIGLGLRAGGVGLAGLAAATTQTTLAGSEDLGRFVLIGTAAIVAGGIYSFATLDNSARERAVVIAPAVQADGTPTLTLQVRF